MHKPILVSLLPLIATGCASTMVGHDGSSQFACKAPDGVTCSSLSGVYANAVAGNLPGLRSNTTQAAESEAAPIAGHAPSSGDPIRTNPTVLRVWMAPWEDSDGDLHDQAYIYMVTDTGRWLIEHNQQHIVDTYRPTFLNTPAATGDGTGATLPGSQGVSPDLGGER